MPITGLGAAAALCKNETGEGGTRATVGGSCHVVKPGCQSGPEKGEAEGGMTVATLHRLLWLQLISSGLGSGGGVATLC